MTRTRLATFISLLVLPAVSAAQWVTDPAVNTPVAPDSSIRSDVAAVADGSGGMILTWREFRPPNSFDLFASRLDTLGYPAWQPVIVAVCTTPGESAEPKIVSDGAGGAVIVWREARGASGWDLYAQRIDSSGNLLWSPDGDTVCAEPGDQDQHQTVTDGAGGAIVIWRDHRTGADRNIYAQRIDTGGARIWAPAGEPVCATGEDQTSPQPTSDGMGGAVIAWSDRRSSTNFDIYAQRLGPSGAPGWVVDGLPVAVVVNDQVKPRIAGHGGGWSVIAWEDARSGTTWDLYGQRLNGSGTPVWTPGGVPVCAAPLRQGEIDIAPGSTGVTYLVWQDERDGIGADIYAQKLAGNGSIEWEPNGLAICEEPGDQRFPRLAPDGGGGAIIVWQDPRNGGEHDVRAQRIGSGGTAEWMLNGAGVSTAPGDQLRPAIVPSGDGNALFAWLDGRLGSGQGIHAQNVLADGSMGIRPWILSSAGENGSIDPEGITAFPNGGSITYTMTPIEGFHVDSVLVNGVYVGAPSSYTFTGVTANTTIHAVFAINVYTMTATAGPNGSISQEGTIQVVHGQTQAYSITPDPGFEIELVHVDGEEIDTTSYYVFHTITRNHTIEAWFGNDSSSLVYMGARWNLVSLPYQTAEDSATVLFPGAATNAFYFDGSYQQGDVLETGRGYWIKYDSVKIVTLFGTPLTVDTIDVAEGWNLIGSISSTVPVNEVQSVPAGIVTSQFFRYSAGYVSAPSIQPSRGYWVKTSQAGQLVLAAGSEASPAARIRIVPTEDLPPAPPAGGIAGGGGGDRGAGDGASGDQAPEGGADGSRPPSWRLEQNHPNPFNPSTTIGYRLPVGTVVRLEVYNAAGERVAVLAEGFRPAGEHRVVWNASGRPSGVYFFRLTAGPFLRTGKMVLMK